MKKGFVTKEQDNICWECRKATNSRLCPWANGIAVAGWKATPTKILNTGRDGITYYTDSYHIEDCPLFEQDYKRVTLFDIADIIGVSRATAQRKRSSQLKQLLKEKGYELRVCKEIDRTSKQVHRIFYMCKNIPPTQN